MWGWPGSCLDVWRAILEERRQRTLCASVGTVDRRQSKRARVEKPVCGPFWVAQVKQEDVVERSLQGCNSLALLWISTFMSFRKSLTVLNHYYYWLLLLL